MGIQRKPNGKQQTQNMSIFMTKYKGFKYPIKTQIVRYDKRAISSHVLLKDLVLL